MEGWFGELLESPTAALLAVILAGGVGVPIPEDVPLVVAGWLCGRGLAEPGRLFPLVFVTVLGADLLTFGLGRWLGSRLAAGPLRRLLGTRRIEGSRHLLASHGGKMVFTSRFVPGLRSPMIFVAGSLHMGVGRFLLFDGAAAMIGVSAILGTAYLLSDQLELVRQRVAEGQLAALGIVVLAVAVYVGTSSLASRRLTARVR